MQGVNVPIFQMLVCTKIMHDVAGMRSDVELEDLHWRAGGLSRCVCGDDDQTVRILKSGDEAAVLIFEGRRARI
jgi:hypothetical protein